MHKKRLTFLVDCNSDEAEQLANIKRDNAISHAPRRGDQTEAAVGSQEDPIGGPAIERQGSPRRCQIGICIHIWFH